ncbi:MAG: amino acid ABC transporter substrate-binding protein [Candidatus Roseilinea sp.]|nr:MAG: amino acid ABC transporter substrate-binding protein [Candidatus Roseilinea sp.]
MKANRSGGARFALALLFTAALCIEWRPALGFAQQQRTPPLKVVTKPLEPFVTVEAGNRLSGFSIDLWEVVAQRIGADYEWVIVQSVTEQIEMVEQRKADVAIAGISMTAEREARIDFSHPFFNAGLQIMVPVRSEQTLSNLVAAVFSPVLLQILGIAMLVTLAMAHLIWLTERNSGGEIPKAYLPGVWEALWWAVNTLTTGEYGDKTKPSGVFKRLLAIAWMVLSVIFVAQFTASITSDLTVQQLTQNIGGPADLPGKAIFTVKGSTAANYLSEARINFVGVDTIEKAYDALENGQAQAIVYDAPVLKYYAVTQGRGKVEMVGPIFKEETYGIVLQPGSPLREPINNALLAIRQDGTYEALYDKWFREK